MIGSVCLLKFLKRRMDLHKSNNPTDTGFWIILAAIMIGSTSRSGLCFGKILIAKLDILCCVLVDLITQELI